MNFLGGLLWVDPLCVDPYEWSLAPVGGPCGAGPHVVVVAVIVISPIGWNSLGGLSLGRSLRGPVIQGTIIYLICLRPVGAPIVCLFCWMPLGTPIGYAPEAGQPACSRDQLTEERLSWLRSSRVAPVFKSWLPQVGQPGVRSDARLSVTRLFPCLAAQVNQ